LKFWISILLLLWGIQQAIGQKKSPKTSNDLQLVLKVLDQKKDFYKQEQLKDTYTLVDSVALDKQLHSILRQLHNRAYLGATIDTFFVDGKQTTAFLLAGERYEWASLKNGNVNPDFLAATGFKERLYEGQDFYYKEVVQLQEKLLTYLENHGYPFAQVYLDSITFRDNQISARINYNRGPIITFDKLKIVGKVIKTKKGKKKTKKVRITKGFMSNYLGIKEGKLYNEKAIQKLQQRLKNLRYLSSYQTPTVTFVDKKAQVNLFLQDRPSSKVDVLFGLLPSQDPVTQQQRFDFTGNIHIDLVNPLGTGKRLFFQWQQIKAGTSDLVLRLEWPYLLQTPLGIDVAFKLYKRDSTFLDVIGDLGVQYLFSGNSYIKAYYQPTATNLININTEAVKNNRQLPSALDLNINTFGLEYYFDNLDYRYNPSKGFESRLKAEFSLKNIRRNNAILEIRDDNDPSFDYGSLYDSLDLNTFRYRFEIQHSHFFKLWKVSTLMARVDAGLILSKSPTYTSELFRIGGNRRLRGFDEESILASWYNILTVEWRFLFGTNSYAYVFGDFAYTQNKGMDNIEQDFPYGFGVGIALETKVGIFGLSYALGSQRGNPILFQNSKVHFGYVYAF
jgi:outer membrane protein assembly factor BamA